MTVPAASVPAERCCSADQPEQAVAAVSDDERQQAKESRLTRDDEERRQLGRRLPVKGDEAM